MKPKIKNKKKRVRYKIPTYKKCDKIIANIKENQAQPHIFRINVLQKVFDEIFRLAADVQTLKVSDSGAVWYKNGLVFFWDEEIGGQAEICGTQNLSIEERLNIHIKLLRVLKKARFAR